MDKQTIIWHNPYPRPRLFPVRKRKKQGESNLIKRLANKIYADTGIRCDPKTFRRTYANRAYLQLGATSWRMCIHGSDILTVSSQYPVSECVKKKYKLEAVREHFHNEILLFPEDK